MTRQQMEARMDYLRSQIVDIENEINSGSYPNWYPTTLAQFSSEWHQLLNTLRK